MNKKVFTLAEVIFSPAEQLKRIVSRIIRVVAGVTSRSNSRAEFAIAHTAHLSHNNSLDCCVRQSRKFGFTLAEVLITLGIIGVVVALTMPSLIVNHRKQVVETKLARVYSLVNQAVRMSIAENGEAADWFKYCGPSIAPECSSEEVSEWFKSYIGKYLKILKIENEADRSLVYFNDGSILAIPNYIYDMFYYSDTKALENPKAGINEFSFRFYPVLLKAADVENNKYTVKSTFEPFVWAWDGTLDGLLHSSYRYGCGEFYSRYCTKLIQMNGWKIPKNYPLKF